MFTFESKHCFQIQKSVFYMSLLASSHGRHVFLHAFPKMLLLGFACKDIRFCNSAQWARCAQCAQGAQRANWAQKGPLEPLDPLSANFQNIFTVATETTNLPNAWKTLNMTAASLVAANLHLHLGVEAVHGRRKWKATCNWGVETPRK